MGARHGIGTGGWALLAVVVGGACNGNDDDGPSGSDTSEPPGPVVFQFNATVGAKAYEAEVAPEAVEIHQVSSMMLAATSVVVADEKVQDRLNVDGAGGSTLFRSDALRCWERPDFPMFSFSIDYSGCADSYNMSGGVWVSDHASGPLLFEFEDFTIDVGGLRTIGGTLALDTRGAYPDPLYWQAYNTDSLNPGLDNPVQIGVDLDRTSFGLSYSGGASVDFGAGQWSMWGVGTVGVGEDALTVVHGATAAEDVAPDAPTGADVLKTPLNWLECRCPTSGIEALDMPIDFTSVTIDIDDLEVSPDDIDDPEMVIPIDYRLPGRAELTHTGCGTYDLTYDTEPVSIPIPTDQLVGAVSFLCVSFSVPDEQRCQAMLGAAALIGDALEVTVSPAEATATAQAAVDADFDTDWCQVY